MQSTLATLVVRLVSLWKRVKDGAHNNVPLERQADPIADNHVEEKSSLTPASYKYVERFPVNADTEPQI